MTPLYTINEETGYRTYDIVRLSSKKECKVVDQVCTNDARMERFKALTKGIVAVGSAALLLDLAAKVAFIAAFIIGVVVTTTFPLSLFPAAIHGLVMVGSGIAAGGAFAYYTIKNTSHVFWQSAQKNWEYSDHLYQQAADARMRTKQSFRVLAGG